VVDSDDKERLALIGTVCAAIEAVAVLLEREPGALLGAWLCLLIIVAWKQPNPRL